MKKLVLASSSPRRQNMFNDLGLKFEIDSPDIDESVLKNEKPLVYVNRVAREKALKVAERHPGKIVLAGDTAIAMGQKIFGQPKDLKDAERMLKLMSGKKHHVISSVCVVTAEGDILQEHIKGVIKFKALTKKDLVRHFENETNWQGRAGGYGIQTTSGMSMIKNLNGCHSGIIGLPLPQAINMLRRCGIDV